MTMKALKYLPLKFNAFISAYLKGVETANTPLLSYQGVSNLKQISR